MSIIPTLIKQALKKPFTNPFPSRHAPDYTTDLKKVNPPVDVPEGFRGKIKYDRAKCIGCRMCVTVCPANAMEFLPNDKKIKHHVLRCTMCAICVEACPVQALSSSKEFLLAECDKKSPNLIEK
ncbi:4Fe-4S binding protein [Candidatus Woesearchaeota archaeon]|nr:4Fe-4S binding protein [Candidatus Woesearchaeota archaeon]